MSIFRKSHIAGPLQDLDRYYQELRATLVGVEPTANIAYIYTREEQAAFAAEHTDINIDHLLKAIGHFKVEVEGLKSIKSKAIKPLR